MKSIRPAPILLVGSKQSVFVSRTADVLQHAGLPVRVLDPNAGIAAPGRGILAKAVYVTRRFTTVSRTMLQLESGPCAIVMGLPPDLFWIVSLLKRRFKRVIGLAFGSDVLRRDPRRDFILGMGLRRLDVVAATNDNVLQAIHTDFPFARKKTSRIIRFGLPVFDCIQHLLAEGVTGAEARRRLGFNPERVLIALGYAASPGQRQLELIEAVADRITLFDGVDFVVPVQYGSDDVIKSVEAACLRHNLALGEQRFRPLKTFHDPTQSALMRLATTVLVNHSITDAFSGTVQEVVYAGNLVLSAEHLPYRGMPGFGTAIRTYPDLATATAGLHPEVLREWSQTAKVAEAKNRADLHAISSWDAVLPDWLALLQPGEQGD